MPYGDWMFDDPSGQWFSGDPSQEENWLPQGQTPYELPPNASPETQNFWQGFWQNQPPYNYGNERNPDELAGPGPSLADSRTASNNAINLLFGGGGGGRGPNGPGGGNQGPGLDIFDYAAAQAVFAIQQETLKLQYANAKMQQTYEQEMAAIRAGDQRAAQKLEVDRQELMQWAQQAHAKAALAQQDLENYQKNVQQQQWFSASSVMANPRPIARKLSLLGVNI